MTTSPSHIRGRTPLRTPFLNQPSRQPPLPRYYPFAPSRPRSSIFNPLSLASSPSPFADPKKPKLFSLRIPSSHLLVSTIAVAFFIFGIFVSSNVSDVLISARAKDLMVHNDKSTISSAFPAFLPVNQTSAIFETQQSSLAENTTLNSTLNSTLPHQPSHVSSQHLQPTLNNSSESLTQTSDSLQIQVHSLGNSLLQPNSYHTSSESTSSESTSSESTSAESTSSDPSSESLPAQSVKSLPEPESKPPPPNIIDGRVSWNRSWPLLLQDDNSHLIPLANVLNFDNNTMLNYFHMHKTGGVTLKAELMAVVNNPANKALAAKRGFGLKYAETCYEVNESINDKSLEGTWRCDFGNLEKLAPSDLKKIDIVMGHQYWELGTESLFSGHRRVRHFSIFRHPLARKLSFFYHFFVRNIGRDEKHVGKDEIIKFLLAEKVPDDPCSRDAGPNYYASRMLSDGIEGFVGNEYKLTEKQKDEAIATVASKLESSYSFVGLQVQNEASQCMLEKLVQVFAHARGINDLVGTPKLSFHSSKMNAGGYPWTSRRIWNAMTPAQKEKYRHVERVDLAIYDMVVQRFKKDAKLFTCEDKVDEAGFADDIYV